MAHDFPGVFITLEGGEGSGKSTQIKRLETALRGAGFDVVRTREPGGDPSAEDIREVLLKGDTERWTAMAEALLMTASRVQHTDRLIKPALEAGKIILCDRYFDSSVAYQGAGRGLGMREVQDLQKMALGSFKPDLTLIFDLPIEVGLSRALAREAGVSSAEDRFERMGTAFHQRLADAFLQIAREEPERCRVIQADTTIEAVEKAVLSCVLDHLSVKGLTN